MFSGIFNYDNPVWRFIGKFFDVLILNVLWTVVSIPIFTAGAAATAVYYVLLKLVRDEEGSTVKSFFKSFKENFKQATVIWLILLAAGAVLAFDLYFFLSLKTLGPALRAFFVAALLCLGAVYLCVSLYVFPLQAKFYNPVKRTLFNAFYMSLRHFFVTVTMMAIDIGFVALVLFAAPFLQPLLFLFGYPLIAFINSFFLVGVFDKYIPAEESPDTEG